MVTMRDQLRAANLKWAAVCYACEPHGRVLSDPGNRGDAYRAANSHRRESRSHSNFISIRLAKGAA